MGGPPASAGDGGDAGEAQGDAVEAAAVAVGAGLAVAADADDDEAGVGLAEVVRGEAESFDGAGAEVFDEDVGGVDEALEESDAVGGFEVAGDGLFAAVVLGEGDAAAEAVADAGSFDFDDFGAEFAEQGGAVGGGEDLAHRDDADAGEGGGGVWGGWLVGGREVWGLGVWGRHGGDDRGVVGGGVGGGRLA